MADPSRRSSSLFGPLRASAILSLSPRPRSRSRFHQGVLDALPPAPLPRLRQDSVLRGNPGPLATAGATRNHLHLFSRRSQAPRVSGSFPAPAPAGADPSPAPQARERWAGLARGPVETILPIPLRRPSPPARRQAAATSSILIHGPVRSAPARADATPANTLAHNVPPKGRGTLSQPARPER